MGSPAWGVGCVVVAAAAGVGALVTRWRGELLLRMGLPGTCWYAPVGA